VLELLFGWEVQVGHDREPYRQYLEQLPPGPQIALKASAHYYWMVDEMEAAWHYPGLTHPLEAKKRMGKTGKRTDRVDAKGLGLLLRNGTLPEVWIPPAGLRDQQESLRLRMIPCTAAHALKESNSGSPGAFIAAKMVEHFVWEYIVRLLSNPNLLATKLAYQETGREDLGRELAEAERQIREIRREHRPPPRRHARFPRSHDRKHGNVPRRKASIFAMSSP
jgi:hypothetical protein